jgi:hypothetical protein
MLSTKSVGKVAEENSILAIQRQLIEQARIILQKLNVACKPLKNFGFSLLVNWRYNDILEHKLASIL